jgi:hypothetical protein
MLAVKRGCGIFLLLARFAVAFGCVVWVGVAESLRRRGHAAGRAALVAGYPRDLSADARLDTPKTDRFVLPAWRDSHLR